MWKSRRDVKVDERQPFGLRVDLDETLGDFAHFVEIIGETFRRCLLRNAAHEDFAVVGKKTVVREKASVLRRRRCHGRVGSHGRGLRSGARDGDGSHDGADAAGARASAEGALCLATPSRRSTGCIQILAQHRSSRSRVASGVRTWRAWRRRRGRRRAR